MTIKTNNNWYKFLSKAVEKKTLKEITSYDLEQTKITKYLKNKTSDQLSSLFDGKNRFAIPIVGETSENPRDREMLDYINQLRGQGWTIDFSEPFGYASKIVKSEHNGKIFQTKRKMKIGPLISALGPKALEFWTKYNKFYTTEVNKFYFNTKYMIIISRVPIDILRMSDHDGWTSCHAPSGGYFKCAIAESVEGGAMAYVVKKDDLEKVDISSEEIFKDKDRKIDGVVPISRLRIRRFVGTGPYEDLELGVPEERIYGNNFPGFYATLSSYLLKAQSPTVQTIKEISEESKNKDVNLTFWNLTGGTYEDSSSGDLFQSFFDSQLKFSGYTGQTQSELERNETEEKLARLINENNARLKHSNLYASVEWQDNEPYVMYGANIEIVVNQEIKFNPRAGERRDLVDRMNSSFGLFYGDDIQTIEDVGKTEFTFTLSEEEGYSLDDFENFIYDVARLDNRIEDLQDEWIILLMQEGYIVNPLYELEEKFDEQIKNFILFTSSLGAFVDVKPTLRKVEINTTQFVNNIQDLSDPNYSDKYVDEFYYSINDEWAKTYNHEQLPLGKEARDTILNNFINHLKLELDRQQSLFEIANQNITRQSKIPQKRQPVTQKTLSDLGITFEIKNYFSLLKNNNNVGFDLNISISAHMEKGQVADQTTADVFFKFVKFLDKNFIKILQFYKQKFIEIIKTKYEEIVLKIKQKQPPQEIKRAWPDPRQERLSQQVTNSRGSTFTEYIGENKNKLFKFDGVTWRIINE